MLVHNGVIRNDSALKQEYGKKIGLEMKDIPEVDSAVLAVGLEACIKDWDDEEGLDAYARFLNRTLGSSAIAASLANRPGVQLLAKESSGSPLIIARHKELPIVLWASEQDAVFAMMKRFQQKHANFKVQAMTPGSMLVVDHGVIIDQVSWVNPTTHYPATYDHMLKKNHYRGGQIIRDWPVHATHWLKDPQIPNSVYSYDNEASKQYTLKKLDLDKVFADTAAIFDPDVKQLVSEASEVYMLLKDKVKGFRSSDHYVYAIFGDEFPQTEVILSATGKIVDILYHKTTDDITIERWFDKSLAPPEKEDDEFAKVLQGNIPYRSPEMKYDPIDTTNRRIRSWEDYDACQIEQQQKALTASKKDSLDGAVTVNKRGLALLIKKDEYCHTHKKMFSFHSKKEASDCQPLKWNVLRYAAEQPNIYKVQRVLGSDAHIYLSRRKLIPNECEHGAHWWWPWIGMRTTPRLVQASYSYVVIEEHCIKCGQSHRVDHPWLEAARFNLVDPITLFLDVDKTTPTYEKYLEMSEVEKWRFNRERRVELETEILRNNV